MWWLNFRCASQEVLQDEVVTQLVCWSPDEEVRHIQGVEVCSLDSPCSFCKKTSALRDNCDLREAPQLPIELQNHVNRCGRSRDLTSASGAFRANV